MNEENVVAWVASDGPVTTLEVDAVRSWANALIRVLPDKGPQGYVRGFLYGAAGEDSEQIAKVVCAGRKIRREAGDTPLVAEVAVEAETGGAS